MSTVISFAKTQSFPQMMSRRSVPLIAATLDTLRASRIMTSLGFQNFEMLDSDDTYVVFGVTNFHSAVGPLTKAYGAAKNESDTKTQVKRLVWDVPAHKGSVMLHQVANQRPIVGFFQH